MRTNVPMFTTAEAARNWDRPLPPDHVVLDGGAGYWAAAEAVEDSVAVEFLRGSDPDDDTFQENARKWIADAVNAAWREGVTHDEWASDALASLRRAA